LQTIEPSLRIVLCVYNVQENREARRMWNAAYNPFLGCQKHKTGWHSSSTLWVVWREHAMSDSMIRRWMRHFNEGPEMCMMIRGATDRLWLMKIWCVQWKRRFKRTGFTISSLSLHFPQISRSRLHEILSDKLRFRKFCSRRVLKMLTDEHKMKQATWHA
jgi:hypothetical protein